MRACKNFLKLSFFGESFERSTLRSVALSEFVGDRLRKTGDLLRASIFGWGGRGVGTGIGDLLCDSVWCCGGWVFRGVRVRGGIGEELREVSPIKLTSSGFLGRYFLSKCCI